MWMVVAMVAVAAASFAVLYPMLTTDTACRYAPMAEAFASGEWREAFHPRFGVGMSVVAGLFRFISGVDGYASCAFVSTLAWAFAAVPLFRLAERTFDRGTAWCVILIYFVCPMPLLWALKGLREPFKMLGTLLMADAIMRRRDGADRVSCPEAILGFAMLALFKVDAILIACALALVYIVHDRFTVRSWSLLGVSALTMQPLCWLVWDWTGYWLPAPQFVPIWQKAFGG